MVNPGRTQNPLVAQLSKVFLLFFLLFRLGTPLTLTIDLAAMAVNGDCMDESIFNK